MSNDKRKQRTWSAFGEVRRRPSEYEIVTHGANWTTRKGSKAPLEQNPSSPQNLWIRTYRDGSPLKADDWDNFRDPDSMTYRQYVTIQSDQEAKVQGLFDQYDEAGATAALDPTWVAFLARVFTPVRYPLHGAQQATAYFAHMAPGSYITNAATFSASDILRRVSLVAYRTRELQVAHPDGGFATAERSIFETDEAWQPLREAIERTLVTYDWAEAFTALNLVILPTIDDVLLRQVAEGAKANGDDLTWLLNAFLGIDAARRNRWSAALAQFAIAQSGDNRDVLDGWVRRWSPFADAAAEALGRALASSVPSLGDADARREQARAARTTVLTESGVLLAAPAEAVS